MITKVKTAGMAQDSWLQERKNSLGGSDMGAVLGMNPYSTPYRVWADKTGRLPPDEDSEAMRQGRDLEDYVARRFTERSGKAVQRYNYLLRNSSAPYLHANIDRRILGEKSGLECKTASALSMRHYAGGEFPEHYYAQCVAYLAVTGWKRWYLAALVLNKAFYIYQITTVRNDAVPDWCENSVYVSPEELDALKQGAVHFWEQYVLPDVPPPADGLDGTTQTLRTIYAEGDGGCMELFGRAGILAEWEKLQRQKKEISSRQAQIKQILMEDLGPAETGLCGEWRILWKEQKKAMVSLEKLRKTYPSIHLGRVMTCKRFRSFRIQKGE